VTVWHWASFAFGNILLSAFAIRFGQSMLTGTTAPMELDMTFSRFNGAAIPLRSAGQGKWLIGGEYQFDNARCRFGFADAEGADSSKTAHISYYDDRQPATNGNPNDGAHEINNRKQRRRYWYVSVSVGKLK
jgi:hypothetical protein